MYSEILKDAVYSYGPKPEEYKNYLDNIKTICLDTKKSLIETAILEKRTYEFLTDIFGKYDRITFDLETPKSEHNSDIFKRVKEELNKKDFDIEENQYVEGSCFSLKEGDDRKYKIGRILNRFKLFSLEKEFAKDPARASSKEDYSITLSINPLDVLLMSTGRGWYSCMNYSNIYSTNPINLFRSGCMIAYLHKKTDDNITNPSGRILFKVYHGIYKNRRIAIFGTDSKVYGTMNKNQSEFIRNVVEHINKNIISKNDVFSFVATMTNESYNDYEKREIEILPSIHRMFEEENLFEKIDKKIFLKQINGLKNSIEKNKAIEIIKRNRGVITVKDNIPDYYFDSDEEFYKEYLLENLYKKKVYIKDGFSLDDFKKNVIQDIITSNLTRRSKPKILIDLFRFDIEPPKNLLIKSALENKSLFYTVFSPYSETAKKYINFSDKEIENKIEYKIKCEPYDKDLMDYYDEETILNYFEFLLNFKSKNKNYKIWLFEYFYEISKKRSDIFIKIKNMDGYKKMYDTLHSFHRILLTKQSSSLVPDNIQEVFTLYELGEFEKFRNYSCIGYPTTRQTVLHYSYYDINRYRSETLDLRR